MLTLEPPASRRVARWVVSLLAAILASACSYSVPATPVEPEDLRASSPAGHAATQLPTKTRPPTTWASVAPTAAGAEATWEPDFIGASPDGQWIASVFGYYPPIWMQVARAGGTVSWTVESDGEGWFEVRLMPVHWSTDGLYLYFTLAPFVDGFVLYMDGSGLQRLDLSDGEVAEVLAGEGELQAFSVSPDSARLAYVRDEMEAELLIVRDLSTGEELPWELADALAQAGNITWSPDSDALVVLVTRGLSMEEARTDVVLLDLRARSQEIVLHDDPRIFYRIQWFDEHTLYLEDYTVTGWSLDLETGEMTLTATPIPTQQP